MDAVLTVSMTSKCVFVMDGEGTAKFKISKKDRRLTRVDIALAHTALLLISIWCTIKPNRLLSACQIVSANSAAYVP